MGFKNRCISLFVILCIALSMFSGVAAGTPVPGALVLDKTAVPVTGTLDEWEITVSLNGFDKPITSDVVLVIDVSGSMGEYDRLVNTKVAAKAFVDNLLVNPDTTRISLVTFSDTSNIVMSFTNDAADLKSAIDALSPAGNTSIQAGIHEASTMLNNPSLSTADNKFIVLLGDGEPNRSYVVTATTGITIEECLQSSPSDYYNTARPFEYANGYTITFDYSNIFATGLNTPAGNPGFPYAFYNSPYSLPCSFHSHTSHGFPNNHGIPTIYEAKLTIDDGIEIYSVALNPGANGVRVLSNIVSDPSHFYEMDDDDPSGLTGAFTEIAGKIIYAARDVTVTDPMGEHFTLVGSEDAGNGLTFADKNGPLASPVFTYHPGNKTIIWEIDFIQNATSPITMTYTVKVNEGVKPGISLETNGKTIVDYTDVDGNPAQKEFHVPHVVYGPYGIINVHLYSLDPVTGLPLNAVGLPASQLADIEFDTIPYTHNGFQALLYGPAGTPYTVDAPASHVFNGKTAYYVPGDAFNFGDTGPVTVTLNNAHQTGNVYFAYAFPASEFDLTYHENPISGQNAGDIINMPASPVTVGAGEKISEPSEPISIGYKFEGWYTDLLCTTPWDFDNDVVSANVDLHAKWTDVTTTPHTITFNADGGLPVPAPQPVSHNGFVTEPTTNPMKVGWEFARWVADLSDEERAFDFDNIRVTGDLTLHAIYIDRTNVYHTVTFNGNGGSPVPSDVSVQYNDNFTAPSEIPLKVSSSFDEWQLNGVRYDFDDPVTTDLILNATYTHNAATFTVVFYDYDSTVLQTLNNVPIYSVIPPMTPDPFRVGYEFDEWQLSGVGYDFRTPVASNLDLYASYIDRTNVYNTVTFDGNGGSPVPSDVSVQYNDNFTAPSEIPLKSGNDFVEWQLNGATYDFDDPVTTGLILVAAYMTNNTLFNVTYDADGGSPVPPIERVPVNDNATQPASPTKSGYRFVHWYESTGSANVGWDFDTFVTSDMTLVARWDRIGGGGTGGGTIIDPSPRQPTDNSANNSASHNGTQQSGDDGKTNENTEEAPEVVSRTWNLLIILFYLIAILFGCYRYRINQRKDE